MLLEEFDPQVNAVIDPEMVTSRLENFPEVTVSCFSKKLFESVLSLFDAEKIAELRSAVGVNPVYRVDYKGRAFAFYQSFVGEPLCVAQYEDLMAMGSRRLILLGNCGVLDRSIEDCGIIIPTSALRDEGTSFHYAAPGAEIPVNKKYREIFKDVLKECGYPFVEGITWTTDACYRETRWKVQRRKEQGAICVEMECAGMQAVCDFRGTEFFQFFYAGDTLDHSSWEPRSLSGDVRLEDKTKILFLAFELGLKIMEEQNGRKWDCSDLILTIPTDEYVEEICAYRQEFLDAGDSMDGTGPLRRFSDPEEWLREIKTYMYPETVPEGKVQATQFIFVRERDKKIVGMLQVRHTFNDYLEKYAGHIGYSVRPSERRKGYAKRMLREGLDFCRTIGLDRVLITCIDDNEASRRTILANGGVYESTVFEPEINRKLQRYWINLSIPVPRRNTKTEERKMLFICYPKCTTCQKAQKWLDERGVTYEFRNIKEENPTEEELRDWHEKSGLPLKRFFNTSGLQYKALNLKERLPEMSEDEQFALLASDGMLIKRPLLIANDFVLVGFREKDYEERLL